jgi:hypothetical protein
MLPIWIHRGHPGAPGGLRRPFNFFEIDRVVLNKSRKRKTIDLADRPNDVTVVSVATELSPEQSAVRDDDTRGAIQSISSPG